MQSKIEQIKEYFSKITNLPKEDITVIERIIPYHDKQGNIHNHKLYDIFYSNNKKTLSYSDALNYQLPKDSNEKMKEYIETIQSLLALYNCNIIIDKSELNYERKERSKIAFIHKECKNIEYMNSDNIINSIKRKQFKSKSYEIKQKIDKAIEESKSNLKVLEYPINIKDKFPCLTQYDEVKDVLYKSLKIGCRYDNISNGEFHILLALIAIGMKNNDFYRQYRFDGYIQKYPYDFYIPNKNIVIEVHGEQHFHPVTFITKSLTVDKEQLFKEQQCRDFKKQKYLKENNIDFIIYSEWKNAPTFYNGIRVFKDINELIDYLGYDSNLIKDLKSSQMNISEKDYTRAMSMPIERIYEIGKLYKESGRCKWQRSSNPEHRDAYKAAILNGIIDDCCPALIDITRIEEEYVQEILKKFNYIKEDIIKNNYNIYDFLARNGRLNELKYECYYLVFNGIRYGFKLQNDLCDAIGNIHKQTMKRYIDNKILFDNKLSFEKDYDYFNNLIHAPQSIINETINILNKHKDDKGREETGAKYIVIDMSKNLSDDDYIIQINCHQDAQEKYPNIRKEYIRRLIRKNSSNSAILYNKMVVYKKVLIFIDKNVYEKYGLNTILTSAKNSNMGKGISYKVTAYNIKTKDSIYFECPKDAANYFKVTSNAIEEGCYRDNHSINQTVWRFCFYEEFIDKKVELLNDTSVYKASNNSKSIIMLYKNIVVKRFDSIRGAERDINISRETIKKQLDNNKEPIYGIIDFKYEKNNSYNIQEDMFDEAIKKYKELSNERKEQWS